MEIFEISKENYLELKIHDIFNYVKFHTKL